MPINRVEIDKVGEQQTTALEFVRSLHCAIEQSVISVSFQNSTRPGAAEDVGDFADRDHVAAICCGEIENGWRGRRRREVAPVGSTHEILGGIADERPCDYATDVQRLR